MQEESLAAFHRQPVDCRVNTCQLLSRVQNVFRGNAVGINIQWFTAALLALFAFQEPVVQ